MRYNTRVLCSKQLCGKLLCSRLPFWMALCSKHPCWWLCSKTPCRQALSRRQLRVAEKKASFHVSKQVCSQKERSCRTCLSRTYSTLSHSLGRKWLRRPTFARKMRARHLLTIHVVQQSWRREILTHKVITLKDESESQQAFLRSSLFGAKQMETPAGHGDLAHLSTGATVRHLSLGATVTSTLVNRCLARGTC